MSSLPIISHHLFVAAAGHESRDPADLDQNQTSYEYFAEEVLATQLDSAESAGEPAGDEAGTEFELSRR